jgi:hypothetical protein
MIAPPRGFRLENAVVGGANATERARERAGGGPNGLRRPGPPSRSSGSVRKTVSAVTTEKKHNHLFIKRAEHRLWPLGERWHRF